MRFTPGSTSNTRTLSIAVAGGFILTALVLLAVIVDDVAVHQLAEHVRAVYSPHGLVADPAIAYGYVYVVTAGALVLWAVMFWAARGPQSRLRTVAAVGFVLGLTVTAIDFTAADYGRHLLPTPWRFLGILPLVVGAVVIALAYRRPPAGGVVR